jgi:hypothetical protein
MFHAVIVIVMFRVPKKNPKKIVRREHSVVQLMRRYAKGRKVAISIPHVDIRFFFLFT